MDEDSLRILQVNTFDVAGGAERISWELHHEYRRRGHPSWLAVGRQRSDDPDVFRLPHDRHGSAWSRAWWRAHERLQPWYQRVWGARLLCRATHALAAPGGVVDYWLGHEDFNYPGAWCLGGVTPDPPTVIHCHNLHGKYFDLRALVSLSRRVPVFVTLHDAWMFAGHCAHSFDCDRWTTGCGDCPAIDAFPPIRRDASHFNWRRKREIYAQCRLYVAAPSRWLLDRAKRSILAPAMADARVIHNGVDLSVFRPGDARAARRAICLPTDARVLLFAANGIRQNPYKDYATLRAAVQRVAACADERRTIFLALGEDAPPERIGSAEIRSVPFQQNPADVARYYQAADVYVHAARVDTFPNTVIEALACGTPVVATAVGGIPEQITSETGVVVPPNDADALACGIRQLLDDAARRRQFGENAARDSRERFDLRRQADEYLAWYAAAAGCAKRTATHSRPLEPAIIGTAP